MQASNWHLLKFTTLPRPDGEGPYMHRLQIVETPWFSVRLHVIRHEDGDRHLHDHPFDFISFVLWGGYTEETEQGIRHVRWFNRKRAEGMHRITNLARRPTVTLVLTTGRRREWGFQTERGWEGYRMYRQRQTEESA